MYFTRKKDGFMQTPLAKAIVEVGQLMYQKGYIVGTEGNISVRLDENRILATPSGFCKGLLTENDLVIIDREGTVLVGSQRVSSEIKLHLAVYDERPDVRAVVHAHPPYCLACMLAGLPFDRPIMAETVVFMGKVPIAPYARPSTAGVGDSIRPWIQQTDFVLLEHHGSVTVGPDVWDAFFKLEMLENTARIYYLAAAAGKVKELPEAEQRALLKLRHTTYQVKGRIIPHLNSLDSE